MSHSIEGRRTNRRRLAVTLLTGVAAMGVGTWAVVSLVTDHPAPAGTLPASAGAGPFAVGQPVRSFGGVLTVTGQDRIGGLTARDLASANHGIPHLVKTGNVQIQLTVRLTNDTDRPLTFQSSRLAIRAGRHAPVAPMSSTLPDGPLGPGVSVEGTLGFVTAQDGSAVTLQVPGTDGPTSIQIGRTAVVKSTEQHDHHH